MLIDVVRRSDRCEGVGTKKKNGKIHIYLSFASLRTAKYLPELEIPRRINFRVKLSQNWTDFPGQFEADVCTLNSSEPTHASALPSIFRERLPDVPVPSPQFLLDDSIAIGIGLTRCITHRAREVYSHASKGNRAGDVAIYRPELSAKVSRVTSGRRGYRSIDMALSW